MSDALLPEFRLLLASALIPLDSQETSRLRQVAAACTDWAAFLHLARCHQVIPLIELNLRQHAADLVPPKAIARLEEVCSAHQQQATLLMLELAAVGKGFALAGIPLCPLKGPWLSQRLFGSPGMRSCGDLDLLVDPASVDQAEVAILAQGYQRAEPAVGLSSRQWNMYRQIAHHSTYQHPGRKFHIELHWGISTPDWLPLGVTSQVLARAQRVTFAGQAILDLNTEDWLTFLLIHGARHQWSRIKWLADIAAFVRQNPSPDWQVVQQRLESYRLERALGLGLRLCEQWLGVPAPLTGPPAQEKLILSLAEEASRTIHNPVNGRLQTGQFHRFKQACYRGKLTPSLRSKVSLLWHTWFIHHDWAEFPLPDWLFPLYIFLRPFLWLRRYHLPLPPKRGKGQTPKNGVT